MDVLVFIILFIPLLDVKEVSVDSTAADLATRASCSELLPQRLSSSPRTSPSGLLALHAAWVASLVP